MRGLEGGLPALFVVDAVLVDVVARELELLVPVLAQRLAGDGELLGGGVEPAGGLGEQVELLAVPGVPERPVRQEPRSGGPPCSESSPTAAAHV